MLDKHMIAKNILLERKYIVQQTISNSIKADGTAGEQAIES